MFILKHKNTSFIIVCFFPLDLQKKMCYTIARVRQTVAGEQSREESPGFIEQWCLLTAGGGDSKESATENYRTCSHV